MKVYLGYIAVMIASSTFGFVFLMVLIGTVKGLIHSKNAVEVGDPMQDDPDVFSRDADPLGKGEMNRFENMSVKPSLPFLILAICIMTIIVGFSVYGLKAMAGSTGTTDAMRKEAKAKAEKNKEKYGTSPAIEEEAEDTGRKKQPSAEDLESLGG
jgi:hypothetical protein